ncbi:hypothetical protein ACGFX8_36305 [Streptomyces sp. NPDC048362]|uniref:hypothetical protein n=1 Tax=Streptomyces sp. NPDC048362 TaxID=3365539 RepID=UPI00371D9E08
MHDEPRLSGTARLLGSYWLDSPYWRAHESCYCLTASLRQRQRGMRLARAALTLAAYALDLTALVITFAG